MLDPQPDGCPNCPGPLVPHQHLAVRVGPVVQYPDNRELLAWVRGFIGGYDAGHADGRADGHDEHHSRCEPFYERLVHEAGRRADRAGHAKAWRDAVLKGLCP